MRHTSGPWRVVKRSDHNGRETDGIVSGDYAFDIASLDYTFGATEDADARLIAAAPDLYAACYAALNALQALGKGLETQKTLAAAIMKAEGAA